MTALVDLGDQRGVYGQELHLRLDDDTTRTVIGPHPASCHLVQVFVPAMGVRADVGLIDDPDAFARHRDGRGAHHAGLTAAARTALDLAIARGRAEQATPTRAFASLDWLNPTGPDTSHAGRPE